MTHKSARSRVEEVHGSPPHAGGSGPAGPGFCGRRLPLQRRRRGQLRARSVASKGSANSAGFPSQAELAELQQPGHALGHGQDAPQREEDEGLPRELVGDGHLRKAHLPAAQRPKL